MSPCVFLDRDGVINCKAPAGDYIRRWEDFRFQPGIVDWVRLFNILNYLVIVVTNQRGIARGLIREEEVARIHENMVATLARKGARIDDVFCCPHEEGACECRKPRPGMIFAAKRKWPIDLAKSVLIGDSPSDRQLAIRCGLAFVSVQDGSIVDILDPPSRSDAVAS